MGHVNPRRALLPCWSSALALCVIPGPYGVTGSEFAKSRSSDAREPLLFPHPCLHRHGPIAPQSSVRCPEQSGHLPCQATADDASEWREHAAHYMSSRPISWGRVPSMMRPCVRQATSCSTPTASEGVPRCVSPQGRSGWWPAWPAATHASRQLGHSCHGSFRPDYASSST